MRRWCIWYVAAVALPCIPSLLEAQRGRRQVAEGNRLYSQEQYDSARSKYLEALADSPDAPLIRFNEGNALYKTGALDKALNAFRDVTATADSGLGAKAWYNLGNNLYRQQQLQESLEAYKQALRIDPNDADAKHNLEFVLNKLNEQQQQRENQDQQSQDDQREQQQQNQQQNQGDEQKDQDERQQEQQQEQQQQRQQDQSGQDEQQQQQQQEERQQDQQQAEGSERQMSREELERLLQAIKENPEQVQRQMRKATRPVRVKKDW